MGGPGITERELAPPVDQLQIGHEGVPDIDHVGELDALGPVGEVLDELAVPLVDRTEVPAAMNQGAKILSPGMAADEECTEVGDVQLVDGTLGRRLHARRRHPHGGGHVAEAQRRQSAAQLVPLGSRGLWDREADDTPAVLEVGRLPGMPDDLVAGGQRGQCDVGECVAPQPCAGLGRPASRAS